MDHRDFNLRLFGVMRRYGDRLSLRLPGDSTVEDLRQALLQRLGQDAEALIRSCAVASDSRLLYRREVLGEETELALLPPVSGG